MRTARKVVVGFAALVTTASALFVRGEDAWACGGCFAPQDNPTVVTDHRMIMSVSKTESTLYDQIKYQGDPASFAWVLPFSGNIRVGLSADVVFSTIDQLTQTRILPPPGCGGFSSSSSGATAGAGGSSGSSGSAPGVTVLKQEVVGPYETVQLQATDPTALQTWLRTNGFNIPPDVAPVIDVYVAEHFNFLALKLVPNKGVTDMRPVRVTTEGANLVLPLRMVAAGTGAKVGITLWVVGEGRYEPQNFGSFIVSNDDLGWDVTTTKSNYAAIREKLNVQGENAVWEIESSIPLVKEAIASTVRAGTFSGPGSATQDQRAEADYLPVKDAQGNVTKTASQVRDEDLTTLLSNAASVRVSRMRADLKHAALDKDLLLRASVEQGELSNVRQLTRCGLPDDPSSTVIRPGDPTATTKPQTGAPANGGETFACAIGSVPARRWVFVGFGSGFVALALATVIRRRRRNGVR